MKVKNKKEIILKGNRFIIRPYRKEDYISLAKNANNKKLAKNLLEGFPNPYTEKDAKGWIRIVLKMYKNSPITNFVIEVDGLAVGTIGGNIKLGKPFILGFGYWLGENYWGKGIMSSAVRLYTNYIFKNIKGIKRIQAEVFLWNKASQKVLIKNGFKLEGILRKATIKDGKIIDECVFSKIK